MQTPPNIVKTPSYLATFQLINLTLKEVLKNKIKSHPISSHPNSSQKVMALHLSSLRIWKLLSYDPNSPFLFHVLNHYLIKKKKKSTNPHTIDFGQTKKGYRHLICQDSKKIIWPSRFYWSFQTIQSPWAAKWKVWSEKQGKHVPGVVAHMLGPLLDLGAQGIRAAGQVRGSCFPTRLWGSCVQMRGCTGWHLFLLAPWSCFRSYVACSGSGHMYKIKKSLRDGHLS